MKQPQIQTSNLPAHRVAVDPALDALAARHARAENLGVQVLEMLNRPADSLIDTLPPATRARLEGLAALGLRSGVRLAGTSRRFVGDQKPWVTTAAASAAGFVGGAGGLVTGLAELPVTVTLMMRGVQAVAAGYGFDPDDAQCQRDCLLVFAAEGPVRDGDTPASAGFLSTRAALTRVSLNRSVALVAPRLGQALGRRLALRAVPVLGAASACAANLSYARYYQDMAHVVFGLRALSRDSGLSYPELAEGLGARREQLMRA